MCRCCSRSREKEKKEYQCAVAPEKCPTKVVDEDQPAPVCCGKPMKPKK
ncbi:MAG: hypothetical protein N2115_06800 [bacterium]|nr:hypothetical protein [bacterium]